jgi:trans-aconitate methyltransferase
MKPETIGKKYNKVAHWWHKHHQNSTYGIKQIERAIHYCKNHQNALDVGCGSGGRIIDKLLQTGFNVKGIDVSENMLELAKVNHPNVEFELTDVCKWESKEKFDLIIAWDSIFHLPMVDQEAVVSKLCNHLKTDGILIYTFGDDYGDKEDYSFIDENGKQVGELDNDKFGYGTIGITENLRVINDNRCKCMHLEIDQYPAAHVYIIAKKIE